MGQRCEKLIFSDQALLDKDQADPFAFARSLFMKCFFNLLRCDEFGIYKYVTNPGLIFLASILGRIIYCLINEILR